MENSSNPPEGSPKTYPISVIFQQTKMFDIVLKKISKKPQILTNFKRIFYIQPKIPPLIHQTRSPSDSSLRIKFPKISQKDIDFYSFSPQDHLYNKPESRAIFTPKWNTNFDLNKQSAFFSQKDVNLPDFDKMHQILEVMESRIINEIDSSHLHTGQILDIAKNRPPTEFTEEERNRISNYQRNEVPNKIPNNWEPRVWDNPSTILNDLETSILYQKIEQNSKDMKNPSKWDFNKNKRKKKTKHLAIRAQSVPFPLPPKEKAPRRLKKAIVMLSTISYETDSDSQDTDWEDLDF